MADIGGSLRMADLLLRFRRCEIRQRETYDCGPAALCSLTRYYGYGLDPNRLKERLCSNGRGARLSDLSDVLTECGFESEGVSAEIRTPEDVALIAQVPLPAIAHTEKNGLSHYLVVYGLYGRRLIVMDPAEGVFRFMSKNDFFGIWKGVLLLALPDPASRGGVDRSAELADKSSRHFFLFRILEMLRPFRSQILSSFAGAMVYTFLGILQSVYLQKIVDNVLPSGNGNLANLLSIGMLAVVLVSVVISVIKSRLVTAIGMRIDLKMIQRFHRNILDLPQSRLASMKSGDLLSRIGDIVRIRAFLNEVLLSVAVNVTVILFSVVLMFSYYWKLGMILFISVPFYYGVYAVSYRLNAISQRRVIESSALFENEMLASIRSVREIRQFNLKEKSARLFRARLVEMMNHIYTSFLQGLGQGTASELISRIFTIVILWAGSFAVIDGKMTPGELLSFYALIAYFISPVASLTGMSRSYQEAKIAFERITEITDAAVEERSDAVVLEPAYFENIMLNDLVFGYPNRVRLFDHLNLHIVAGTHVAFVGRSGCGKSSLLLLLQRLYPADSGKITFSGIDIGSIDERCIGENVAVVSQSTVLFDTDFIHNIAVGDDEPDMKRIVDLCIRLDLYDFIMSLPDSFLTKLGENGTMLSGGQRQKVAVARAFYRKSRLMILDEATASVDIPVEEEIRKMIREYTRMGNTVVSAAHRLRMAEDADVIYVLEKGKIVEWGTHRELMDKNGWYASMRSSG